MDDNIENTEEENGVEIEEVLLLESNDGVQVSQVCAALDMEKIPYAKIEEGSSFAIGVYTGFPDQIIRIIVRKEDYEKAKEIISPILTTQEEEGLDEVDIPDELKYAEDIEEETEEELEDGDETNYDNEAAYTMLWMILMFLAITVPAIIILFLSMS